MANAKRLPVLCAHTYEGIDAVIVPCNRCGIGWHKATKSCKAYLGVEHFPTVSPEEIPSCPLEDRCQHQVQQKEPCLVRARGMICESALVWAGDPHAADHPLGFNANVCATVKDLE